ncbi:MAG: 4Fe-4S binding protein [Clostridia bacterium]|nr:4Fe-4S binding protein [Clostridia bacterium]MDQ7791830.1 4Fe-4S binding protein [Clostridia bacterium]
MDFEYQQKETKRGTFTLFPGLCKGCGLCIEKCPKKCLGWSRTLGVYGMPAIEPINEDCISCGVCSTVCPDCAILVERYGKEDKKKKETQNH